MIKHIEIDSTACIYADFKICSSRITLFPGIFFLFYFLPQEYSRDCGIRILGAKINHHNNTKVVYDDPPTSRTTIKFDVTI